MIEPKHLTDEVIVPVLRQLKLYSQDAARLVLGTACVESDCGRYLTQLGQGPARGIYQMEVYTHDYYLWERFLRSRDDLCKRVNYWRIRYSNGMGADEMQGNLYYATAMCRVFYLQFREPIPSSLEGQAAYWKRFYNTEAGKGTVEGYIAKWRQYAGGVDVGFV